MKERRRKERERENKRGKERLEDSSSTFLPCIDYREQEMTWSTGNQCERKEVSAHLQEMLLLPSNLANSRDGERSETG